MPVRNLAETQAFFGQRAAGWEDRFPDDDPLFGVAVDALDLTNDAWVLDAGCGSGRALPIMANRVGPNGRVVGFDATPEMVDEARRLGRGGSAALFVGDVANPGLPAASFDAILAAGLLPHLPDPSMVLLEFARLAKPGARLAIFHPVDRRDLAARHGDDPEQSVIAPPLLTTLVASLPWELESIHDANYYLAVARFTG